MAELRTSSTSTPQNRRQEGGESRNRDGSRLVPAALAVTFGEERVGP
jgi:hypothetical protein